MIDKGHSQSPTLWQRPGVPQHAIVHMGNLTKSTSSGCNLAMGIELGLH